MRINYRPLLKTGGKTTYARFNTGGLSRKISNTAAFHAEMFNKLNEGNTKSRILKSGARSASEFFSQMLDSKARSEPNRFHHIYEWDQVGNSNARLFTYDISGTDKVLIDFSLLPSNNPNKDGYVFTDKAYVMETGSPVSISPKNSDMLVFDYEGKTIFTSKTINVMHPGGTEVAGSFNQEAASFMKNHFLSTLEQLGFFNRITKGMERESRVVVPRITKSSISSAVSQAKHSADRIASMVEATE